VGRNLRIAVPLNLFISLNVGPHAGKLSVFWTNGVLIAQISQTDLPQKLYNERLRNFNRTWHEVSDFNNLLCHFTQCNLNN